MRNNRDNSGALFQNHKRRGQSSPHYTGRLMINGVEYFISAWKKTAGSNSRRPGQTFLSMSVIPQSEMDGGWSGYQQHPNPQQGPRYQQHGQPPTQRYDTPPWGQQAPTQTDNHGGPPQYPQYGPPYEDDTPF